MECKLLPQYGDLLRGRCGHSSFQYKDNIYVFSGSSNFRQSYNFDKKLFMYKFNPITCTWTKLNGSIYIPNNYSFGVTCIVFEKILYSFGGNFGGNCKSEILTYDLEKEEEWKKVTASNHARFYCSTSVLYGSKVFLFGGKIAFDGNDDYLEYNVCNLLQIVDLKTLNWDIKYPQEDTPSGRFVHTSFLWKGKMFVYGGFNGDTQFEDMHSYDLELMKWKEIKYIGKDIPSKRRSTSSIVAHDKAYIFGGFDGVNFLNDLWSFDLYKNEWKLIELNEKIVERRFHSSVVIPDYNRFYIFGGFSEKIKGNIVDEMIEFKMNDYKSIRYKIYQSINKYYTDVIFFTQTD